jgi:hypothetical protein
MGLWYDIKPRSRNRKQRWRFAHYIETPSEREDGNWLDAIYFRDEERKIFGKLEYIGHLERRDFRSIATKIEQDEEYRRSLLLDDPELPKIWKRK